MAARDTIEVWDNAAASFDEEADHGLRDPRVRAAWRALLVSLLPRPPARVVDLGCGTGSLSLLLAGEGYAVTGVDFSHAMVRRARAKAAIDPAGRDVGFVEADVADPPLAGASFDVALSRHVLWAMPDPAAALSRWVDLVAPTGCLVLVEGHWSTGAGLTADDTLGLVASVGRRGELRSLPEPAYWGREITDERYAVVVR